MREYAWNYFQVHADQRLKMFNFFILMSTLVIGGFFSLSKNGSMKFSKWCALIPFCLTFFSFVFWKLEERTRMLVKNGERALKYIDNTTDLPDSNGMPHPLRLFDFDDAVSNVAPRYPLISAHFSYSRSFRWVFCFFGLLGILGTIICLLF